MVTMLRRIVSERDQLPEPLASRYASPANAIYDLATAICTLFRLFGDTGITGVDLSKASHPPSRLRQMMILNTMGNSHRGTLGQDALPGGRGAVLKSGARMWRTLTN